MDEPRQRHPLASIGQQPAELPAAVREWATARLVALRTLLVRMGRTWRSSDWDERGGIRLARAVTIDAAATDLPLADAPRAYRLFRDKADGCVKVVLRPDGMSG